MSSCFVVFNCFVLLIVCTSTLASAVKVLLICGLMPLKCFITRVKKTILKASQWHFHNGFQTFALQDLPLSLDGVYKRTGLIWFHLYTQSWCCKASFTKWLPQCFSIGSHMVWPNSVWLLCDHVTPLHPTQMEHKTCLYEACGIWFSLYTELQTCKGPLDSIYWHLLSEPTGGSRLAFSFSSAMCCHVSF